MTYLISKTISFFPVQRLSKNQEILIIPEKSCQSQRSQNQAPLFFQLYFVQCFRNERFVFYKKVNNTWLNEPPPSASPYLKKQYQSIKKAFYFRYWKLEETQMRESNCLKCNMIKTEHILFNFKCWFANYVYFLEIHRRVFSTLFRLFSIEYWSHWLSRNDLTQSTTVHWDKQR